MSHYAVITTGLAGILNASFEIVSRLEKEGHKVTYLCPWDVKEKVESYGFSYVQLPKINFEFSSIDEKQQTLNSQDKSLIYRILNPIKFYDEGKKRLKLEIFKNAINDIKPDRVLIDVELHELIFSTIALKIPITLLSQWFPNRENTNGPPIQSSTIPEIGFLGTRLGIFLLWWNSKTKTRLKEIKTYIIGKNYRSIILKQYATEVGLSKKSIVSSRFPPVFEYNKLPILSMVMSELDFFNPSIRNVTYLGAVVFDKRDNVKLESAEMMKIDKIFSLKSQNNQKLIYCSIGSMKNADTFFVKKVIKAVAKRPEWILIASLGGKFKLEDFQNTSKNVHLFNWVPQLRVLQNADCSINHGGIHTINECIHCSVPMLVYSGKQFDQNGCAARVAYHGLGIFGDKGKDSIVQIEDNIHRILNDQEIKMKMNEFHKLYLDYQTRPLTPILSNF